MSRPKPDALPLGDGPLNFYFNTSKDIFLSKKYKVFINMEHVLKNKKNYLNDFDFHGSKNFWAFWIANAILSGYS